MQIVTPQKLIPTNVSVGIGWGYERNLFSNYISKSQPHERKYEEWIQVYDSKVKNKLKSSDLEEKIKQSFGRVKKVPNWDQVIEVFVVTQLEYEKILVEYTPYDSLMFTLINAAFKIRIDFHLDQVEDDKNTYVSVYSGGRQILNCFTSLGNLNQIVSNSINQEQCHTQPSFYQEPILN